MKIGRFEQLESWQAAREFVKYIYKLTNKPKFAKDHRLAQQITESGVSIMSNIAEGCTSHSTHEFIESLRCSRRFCAECQNCLYVALDQTYIVEDEFQKGYDMAVRIIHLIDRLLRYLRSLPSAHTKRPRHF